MIITMAHIRKARMCRKGACAFFKKHNLDWTDFLKNGISAEKLVLTEDAMALQVVELCRNGR